jgi:protein-disulfide isomerase
MDTEKNNLMIPAAIIIAGIIIAFAFFNTKSGGDSPNPDNGNNNDPDEVAINIKPISEEDHILGNPNADIIIVEFSDLECPFCKNYHQTMQRIIDEFGKSGRVAWVYRHFPLTQLHPKAQAEAEATECAGELGGNTTWWDYTNRIFEITPSNNGLDLDLLPEIAEEVGLDKAKFIECFESGRHRDTVKADFDDAVASGGRGTPYSVFLVKGQEPAGQSGALSYDNLKGLIEQTLLNI